MEHATSHCVDTGRRAIIGGALWPILVSTYLHDGVWVVVESVDGIADELGRVSTEGEAVEILRSHMEETRCDV